MPGSAAQSASMALQALIDERGYRVGDRLPPERDLSEALGVSRPTVREAIGRMVAEGILHARRGSGTYVAPVELGHVFTVRLALEPLAAALAAQHRTRAQLRELRSLLDHLNRSRTEPAAFADVDARMHDLVADASGNPVLRDVLYRLAGLAKLSRAMTSGDDALRDRTAAQMSALVSAIAAGDPARAEDAMRDHLAVVRASLGDGAG